MRPTEDSQLPSHLLDEVGQRAFLPAVMFPPDVRRAAGFRSDSYALRQIKAGAFGPVIRLGRRTAVLREDFLAALQALRQEVGPPPGPPPVPKAPAWAVTLLQRGRRRGLDSHDARGRSTP
jgi:hypothetical protein